MIVYYRLCHIPSTNPPPVFEDDKYRLNRLCLKSFVTAFEKVNPHVVFLCDYCPPEYTQMIESLVPFTKEIIHTQIGINETCLKQYDLYEKTTEDKVLFIECDYLWVGSGKTIVQAIEELDFVSPYDHPDKYDLKEVSEIRIAGNHHFKSTISTTSTFACRRDKYNEFIEVFKKYGYIDHTRWVEVKEKGGTLWSPIPTLATHMVKSYLSPTIEWTNHYSL